ncbi:MAG: rRNA maturation RNase YbeY [Bacteroidetes bacterium]|nr:MAG: rRNA maturation RNase YbeY [Bacteroidota bacterium]
MLPSSGEICFNSIDIKTSIHYKTILRKWVTETISTEGKTPGEISFNFCSDDYLLEINRTYLNHDYYTDIITFELNEGSLVIGDIYISIDRVKENAESLNVPYQTELHRVMIHGILHLCGYKDKGKKDAKQMRDKEDYYLSLFAGLKHKQQVFHVKQQI